MAVDNKPFCLVGYLGLGATVAVDVVEACEGRRAVGLHQNTRLSENQSQFGPFVARTVVGYDSGVGVGVARTLFRIVLRRVKSGCAG